MAEADIPRITHRFEEMKAARALHEPEWQDQADFVLPRRGFFTQKPAAGQRLTARIFDTTAVEANELLAAGLHGMLTSPTEIWFDLTIEDEALARRNSVVDWLHDTARRMNNALNNSNYQTEVHELYLDLGCFGTSAMFIEEDPALDVRFTAWPLNEVYVAENAAGLVDTVYRSFSMTARQAAERERSHGWVLSPNMLKAIADQKPDQSFQVLHAIEPRYARDPRRADRGNMAWASCYVVPDEKHKLHEGGYNEFPVTAPRWSKAPGEIYGRSPASHALDDIKMLNTMSKTTLRAAQKAVDPPLLVADDGVLLPVDTRPSGLIYARFLADGGDPVRPLKTGAEIGLGLEMEEQRREAIRAHFFVDHMRLREGPQMTATEVLTRTEEKLRLMGPMLGRMNFEFLRPLIDRVFAIMLRRGKLLPPPPELEGARIGVIYVSPVAKAQKASQALGLLRALETVAPMLQIQPDLADNIDGDKAVRAVMDAYSMSMVLRDPRHVAALRQARAQATEEEMSRQAVTEAMGAAGKMAPALKVMQGGAT